MVDQRKGSHGWLVVVGIVVLVLIGVWHHFTVEAKKTVHVRGYYRRDGTYVNSYYRRPPGTAARSNEEFEGGALLIVVGGVAVALVVKGIASRRVKPPNTTTLAEMRPPAIPATPEQVSPATTLAAASQPRTNVLHVVLGFVVLLIGTSPFWFPAVKALIWAVNATVRAFK